MRKTKSVEAIWSQNDDFLPSDLVQRLFVQVLWMNTHSYSSDSWLSLATKTCQNSNPCLSLHNREETTLSVIFFSGRPDRQPELAELLLWQLSCPVDSALRKHPRGSSRSCRVASSPPTAVKAQILQKRRKKTPAACGFHLSFSRFSCDIHAPFGLCYFSQALCFNAQLCLHFIPSGFGLQSFARWHLWILCLCLWELASVERLKSKMSRWSSSGKPYFSSSLRRRFEDVLFWFVPSAAGPDLRLFSLLLWSGTLAPRHN